MFKTMDGVDVYTADEVYNKEQVEEKLGTKATVSEVNSLVSQRIDNVITSKVNEIAGTFESTIDSKVNTKVTEAIGTALSDYDNSNTVDSKISTAIDTELADYDTSAQVTQKINTAIANIPAGPTAMTAAEATALINQYL